MPSDSCDRGAVAQHSFPVLLPSVVCLASLLEAATGRGAQALCTGVLAYTAEEGELGTLSPPLNRNGWGEGLLIPSRERDSPTGSQRAMSS